MASSSSAYELNAYDNTDGLRRTSVAAAEQSVGMGKGGGKGAKVEQKEVPTYNIDEDSTSEISVKIIADHTHRRLRPRHIQLIGIGGTIGTALYVAIGRGLLNGGPLNLFLAFTMWSSVIIAVTFGVAEMVTYLPVASPFIRFAGTYVDDAFGIMVGYNFFVFEAALIPFEVVACNVILHYWTTAIPVGAVIAVVLVIYAAINLFAVKYYGESEFWLAIGKVLLIVGLISYAIVTMLGGNPLNDRYGFRYWQTPGAINYSYGGYEGALAGFLGFLACLIQASFTIAGPEYVSMAAGEAENPRKVMPRAFNGVLYRLTAFFILGSLAVGIVLPYDDANLIAAYKAGAPGAAASPYVASMVRLKIQVLPDIVNALILASAFSAGNSYVYCASRSLYGLALEGKAPRVLAKCNKQGVPIYCVLITLAIALLSFLQVSNNSAVVLQWFVNLVTASQLINFAVMSYTFICWKRACEAQGLDRNTLPYKSRFQPYLAWYGLVCCIVMSVVSGYQVFLPGAWDVTTFIFSYAMIFLCPIIFVIWKVVKKTKWLKPTEVKLRTHEVDEIEDYTRNFVEKEPKTVVHKFFNKILG